MPQLPLITIGIPAYGRPAFLREAIQSCLAQTYPHLEILVADDCSPVDPWPEIADLKNERWSYVRHQKNLKGTGNFNYLINQAKGDLFILHQDDDRLHPEFCQRAAEAMTDDPAAAFYSGWLLRGSRMPGVFGCDLSAFAGPWELLDYLEARPQKINALEAQLMLLFSIPFMHPALAMRLDFLKKIGGYFSEFMQASDNITLARLLFHGHALYDTRLSGFYRLHSGNVSSSFSLAYQHQVRRKLVSDIFPQIKLRYLDWTENFKNLLKNIRRRDRWLLLKLAVEAGYPPEFQRILAESLSSNPQISLWRARLFKASWAQQWHHFFR